MASKSRQPKSGYIAGLDGWRALAILAVVMAHDQPWTFRGHSNAAWKDYGGWSVWLFFAISGYLVCDRILADEEATGRFRVRELYIRRLLRIKPAATLYLAAIALLTAAGVAHESSSSLFSALFMVKNYTYVTPDPTGHSAFTPHFWSLAVEEHFYILLSALLLVFKRGRVAAFCVVIGLFMLWSRVGPHLVHYAHPIDMGRRTEFNLQYLLLASLFALLLRDPNIRARAASLLTPPVAFGLTAAALLLLGIRDHHLSKPLLLLFWHDSVWFYMLPLWIVATVLHPGSRTVRALEWKPLKFVGRLSYSLYLWQMLFFAGGVPKTGIHAPWLLFLCERPWCYVASAAAACFSFYLVERPLQRLGHRLAPPSSAGHKDLGDTATATAVPQTL